MKMTIESTTKIVNADGIDCRIWEGTTERGVKVICLIPRIAVQNGQDMAQFDEELQEMRAPTAVLEAFPLKLIL